MNFTQYKFPRGTPEPVTFKAPADIEALAAELVAAGFRFEIECHPGTQMVHMDCCDNESPLASRVVANGEQVPGAVADLVRKCHERWVKLGRPRANTRYVEDDDLASDSAH